jgi:GTP-binding protein HflX
MQQKESVEKILTQLDLDDIPVLYVFNKMDRVDMADFDTPWLLNEGVCICARQKQSLTGLIEKLESMVTLPASHLRVDQ